MTTDSQTNEIAMIPLHSELEALTGTDLYVSIGSSLACLLVVFAMLIFARSMERMQGRKRRILNRLHAGQLGAREIAMREPDRELSAIHAGVANGYEKAIAILKEHFPGD